MRNAASERETGLIDVQSHSIGVCIEEYAALTAPMFAISPIASDAPCARIVAKVWHSDLCNIGYGERVPFSRRRATTEIGNAGHLIEVTRFLSGFERGISGNGVINRIPDPIYILDQEQPVQSITSQIRVQQLYVPKLALGLSPDVYAKERMIENTGSVGRLLHACMTDLYASLAKNGTSIQSNLIHRFFALLKINLGVHPQRGDVRAHVRDALFEQICIYIEQNLGDPRLSSESLLGSFGVSRASLYRMFKKYGGVRTYITARRSVRAVLDISCSPRTRGKLRRVSERWGFSTQPNFNRTIRSIYGTSPSALFG